MRIQNNITAVNSHRQYNINNGRIARNMEQLSSGFRVNRAADDAAGLAISEKMRAQIRGLNMASRNSQDAISLVQTAEGGLQTIQDILQRVRELSVQAANDTNQDEIDREALDLEVNQLLREIDDIASTTEFNGMPLLDGRFEMGFDAAQLPDTITAARSLFIQAGANQGQTMTINIRAMSKFGLRLNLTAEQYLAAGHTTEPLINDWGSLASVPSRVSVLTRGLAHDALGRINTAINCVSMMRAELGAFQNRLEFKVQNLNNQAENVAAAESRIRDADMALMMTDFTRNNILFQASTAMLAQANALPQGVLQLLG
ncbi:MAG: flagellin [Oscillospiraceae bacterium]|nr:flagellin [Oscillospiraceae bacterium]